MRDKKAVIQMAYASTIGLVMVITIFGGLYLGNYLDNKFQMDRRYFTFLFLAVGIFAAFYNLYKLIRQTATDEEPVIKILKSEPHRKRPPPSKA